MVWRVVEDEALSDSAQAVARRLADQPRRSLASMKRVLRQTAVVDFECALELESEATVEGFMDPLTTTLLKDF